MLYKHKKHDNIAPLLHKYNDMNRLTATAMSLALGLTNAKCATDASIGSNTQTGTTYSDVVARHIGNISTDAGTDTAPDKNPCNKLDPNWKTMLSGEYAYNPPPNMGADRVTLEGVSKVQVFALAKLIRDKVVTQLCYAQETINPIDAQGDAVRVCNSIEVQYNGEPTSDNEDVYVLCHIKDPLPQGPTLLPQYEKGIIEDEIGISSNTALEYPLDPEGSPMMGLDTPALYKTRIIEGGVGSGPLLTAHSFFLTNGNQDSQYGTGDFKRRSRIWISGK